jgi:hypothetical protein
MIADLMRLADGIPNVAVVRRANLGPVVSARSANAERPPWPAIFTKAFAIVADDFPVLRRAYMKYPTPHFYEYISSVAALTVERDFEGEPTVFLGTIKNPSTLQLAEIARRVRFYAEAPVTEIKDFRRAIAIARLPAPLRRALFTLGFELPRPRANYFGTFGVMSLSGLSAVSTLVRIAGSSLVYYGLIAAEGLTDTHLVFDHRVFDGLVAARILARLEDVLNGAIADELRR